MTPKERAANGASLLDERNPGWYRKIDCAVLNIASPRWCVLGQVYGGYGLGLNALHASRIAGETGKFGFAGIDDGLDALNESWREEIAARRLLEVPVAEEEEVGMEAYC